MNTLDSKKREVIVRVVTKVLNSEEGVVFTNPHGFLVDSVLRDIDIFVYT